MIVRGFVAVALLASFFAGPCLAVCEGWSASAHARMACCVNKEAAAADACCASAAGHHNSESAPAVAVFPAALEIVPIASAVATRVEHVDFDRNTHHPLTANTDRHALLSTFLI